ncbi:MAG: anthranilate phosphoribosyltransferase, partial [Solirubrobacterales bacterium]
MPDQVLTRAIDRLASGEDLDAGEVESVLTVIMEGGADEVQTAGFLIALRTKGETVEELAGMARTMRRLATPVTPERQDVVDTAG